MSARPDHTEIHRRFRQFLTERRVTAPAGRDIRSFVLSAAADRVAFGLTRRNLERFYPSNLPLLFPDNVSFEEPGWSEARAVFGLGTIWPEAESSHPGLCAVFHDPAATARLILIEQGFLASAGSWALSFQTGAPAYACLGYVYDDIAHYFMAEHPNRLIDWLNSGEELTPADRARARTLMEALATHRVSKYNAQTLDAPAGLLRGDQPRVLVCDQSYADASTAYGLVDDVSFQDMLRDAILENPGAEILVKTHPDTAWEPDKRKGYFTGLTDRGSIRVIRDPVSPFALFDAVDAVYVATSGLGMEALFAGKRVVTYGAPFFAGWGLTDDRLGRRRPGGVPHRRRVRALEDLFHAFYVWYTIYHAPGRVAPCEIEDVVDFVLENRPSTLRTAPAAADPAPSGPRVSVVVPVHNVERYVEQCLRSVMDQTLRDIEIIPVDDASPDGSARIVARLAAEDPRIRPIRMSENVGQGFARNAGLDAARGEYVWFIDGDDFMAAPDALERLVAAAESGRCDMVRGRKAFERIEDSAGREIGTRLDRSEAAFEQDAPTVVTDLIAAPRLMRSRHFWTFLYRRAFVERIGLRFLTRNWEERPFLLRALLEAERIGLTPVEATVYRVRETGTTRGHKSRRDVESLIASLEAVADLLEAKGATTPGSPLSGHAAMAASQQLNHIFRGFAPAVLDHPENSGWRPTALARIAAAFRRLGVRPAALTCDPESVDDRLFAEGVYGLMMAALRADEPELALTAARRAPIAQEDLYRRWLAPARTEEATDLVDALTRYARNERVRPAPPPADRSDADIRLLLHIGATKTGSTSLQHFLDANRPALLRLGIWTPEFGLFRQSDRPWKTAGHANFLRAASAGKAGLRKALLGGLGALERLGARPHTVVLSSEAFFLSPDATALIDYLDGFRVEMVVYLRRQDDWAEAQYCEFVAGGAIGRVADDPETWLAAPATRRRLSYDRLLAEWREALAAPPGSAAAGRIHVRPYERGQLRDGDVVADFCALLGVGDALSAGALVRPQDALRNERAMSAGQVAAMRWMNRLPFRDADAYLRFVEEAGRRLAASPGGQARGRPRVFGAQTRRAILDALARGNAEVARIHLGRADGRLFLEADLDDAPPDEAVLRGAEIDALFGAYWSVGAPEPEADTRLAPPRSLVNYGIFGWRRALKPVLRPLVRRLASRADRRRFEADPALFLQSLTAPHHRLASALLYPRWPVYGPLGVFRLWTPLVARVVARVGGAQARSRFEADPAVFFRSVPERRWRMVGRLLYPCGELPGRSAE